MKVSLLVQNLLKILIPTLIFTLVSIIVNLAVVEADCDSLTEEKYLKTDYYLSNKIPYEEGLQDCKNLSKGLLIAGVALPFIGLAIGFSNYLMGRKNKAPINNGVEDQ